MKLSRVFKNLLFLFSICIIITFVFLLTLTNQPLISQAHADGPCIVPPVQVFGFPPCFVDGGDLKDLGGLGVKLSKKSLSEVKDALAAVASHGGDACQVLSALGASNPNIGMVALNALINQYGCDKIPGGGGGSSSSVDCSTKDRNSCENSNQQCFWYRGYTSDPFYSSGGECRKNNGDMCNRNDGTLCGGGHCYKDQVCMDGQYCASGCPSGGQCTFQCGGYAPSSRSSSDTCSTYPDHLSGSAGTTGYAYCSDSKCKDGEIDVTSSKYTCSAEFCCYGKGSPGTNTGHIHNPCDDEGNADHAFACFDASSCPADHSHSTNNSGLYSCAPRGGICCGTRDPHSGTIHGGGPGAGGGTTGGGTNTTPTAAKVDDVCSRAGKGQLDSSVGGPYPGYINATCDKKEIGETDPSKAQPGRKYYDKYQCTQSSGPDGKYVYVESPSANNVCDHFPWIDDGATLPKCYSANDPKRTSPIDCAATNGSNWVCTFDYTSTGNNASATHCSPDGKRWCPTASTWVTDAQGCGGLQAGIGQTCGEDKQCADYPQGARCKPFGSSGNTCQWPGGTPPPPTPGASTSCSTPGLKGTGCPCSSQNSCGCATSHNPELSLDGDNRYYCVPFPAVQQWCNRTQSLMPNGSEAKCQGSTAYSTPTPTINPAVYTSCLDDGNHLCAKPNQCADGYGPTNNPLANQACAMYNPSTPLCYVKGATPLSSCTTGSGGGTGSANPSISPAASGPALKTAPQPCTDINNSKYSTGTFCSSTTSCFDIYTDTSGNECSRVYSGATCTFCANAH